MNKVGVLVFVLFTRLFVKSKIIKILPLFTDVNSSPYGEPLLTAAVFFRRHYHPSWTSPKQLVSDYLIFHYCTIIANLYFQIVSNYLNLRAM